MKSNPQLGVDPLELPAEEVKNRLEQHSDDCPYGNEDCPGAGTIHHKDHCARCMADSRLMGILSLRETIESRNEGNIPSDSREVLQTEPYRRCPKCGTHPVEGVTPSGLRRPYCPRCAGDMDDLF